jgi:holliday junction DNA helicase RuvB
MLPEDHVFNPHALGPDPSGEGAGPDSRPSKPTSPGISGESAVEAGLRPTSLGEFVGQPRIVGDLKVALAAAQGRDEALDHVLFSGPPGLGKTSLARILSVEMGSRLHATSGPAMEKPKDLIGILSQLHARDVLFIDEIHRVPNTVEEYLYTAMEDFRIEVPIDSGPHARLVPIPLQHFTLVGATTREGLLSGPFRARFGLFERLDPYPVADLVLILERAAGLLGIGLDPEGARVLAERARGTPRVAGRFLRRARDRAQVAGKTLIDGTLAETTLEQLGVDGNGLEEMDRRILRCLAQSGGGPLALKTIAAVVDENEDTIENAYEPHLLRQGLVRKTARGRILTAAGASAVGASLPEADRGDLFDG